MAGRKATCPVAGTVADETLPCPFTPWMRSLFFNKHAWMMNPDRTALFSTIFCLELPLGSLRSISRNRHYSVYKKNLNYIYVYLTLNFMNDCRILKLIHHIQIFILNVKICMRSSRARSTPDPFRYRRVKSHDRNATRMRNITILICGRKIYISFINFQYIVSTNDSCRRSGYARVYRRINLRLIRDGVFSKSNRDPRLTPMSSFPISLPKISH